jgi:hypothetical protein
VWGVFALTHTAGRTIKRLIGRFAGVVASVFDAVFWMTGARSLRVNKPNARLERRPDNEGLDDGFGNVHNCLVLVTISVEKKTNSDFFSQRNWIKRLK